MRKTRGEPYAIADISFDAIQGTDGVFGGTGNHHRYCPDRLHGTRLPRMAAAADRIAQVEDTGGG